MSQKSNLSTIISIIVAVVIALGGLGGGYYLYNKASKLQTKNTDTVVTDINGTGVFGSLLFGKESYELNYHDKIDDVKVISLFELGDKWQSTGYWDKRIFLEGEASLAVNADNRVPQQLTYTLDTETDFSASAYISYFISLTDFQVLESQSIKIGDEKLENYYIYNITNLHNGWNYVRVPLKDMVKVISNPAFDLTKVKTIQLEVVSRPNNSLVANFDYMQVISNVSFINDWQGTDPTFIGLAKMGDNVVVRGTQDSSFQSTITAVPGIKDGVLEVAVSPQTQSSSAGLFFRGSYKNSRGYYFVTGGKDSNQWFLKKYSDDGWTDLLKGEISNFVFESTKLYYLRVILSGNEIKLYFSLDGNDFTELATINDDSYLSGGVGLAVFDAYAFFDDLKVTK